jgi:hypothetical protein
MNKQSSQSCASLAACSNCAENRCLEGDFLVAVWHKDLGVVTTEFKDGLAEPSVDISADVSTNGS